MSLDQDLGRAVLELVTDPTKMRAGLAGAREEALGTVRGAQRALASAGAQLDQTGQKLTLGVTVPVLAAGKAITDVGLSFDTTLRQIVGLTDVTKEEIGGIREQILALGGEVGKTPQDLAEAFYFVASAGFKADEAMGVLRTAAVASAAGLGTVGDVAKVLGLTLNAYGHDNITSARAADILTAAVKDGTAEADAFASVLGRVVPTAATLGVAFDQVTAALAGMTLTGLSADEAATSLNQVLVSLLKPTTQAEAAMAGMGLTAQGLRTELREKGLLETLRHLQTSFEGNDEAASQVFGNVRALRGVLSLLTLDSDQLNKVFADTNGALGDLANGYADTEGPARDLARAHADLDAALIDLSTDVLPVVVDLVRSAVGVVRDLAGWFKALPPDVRETVIRLLALAAALGPILLITGKLLSAVTSLWGGLDKLATVMFSRVIPAISGITIGVGSFKAALGPLLPLLAYLNFELDRFNQFKDNPDAAIKKSNDNLQWAIDHPLIPVWLRGVAEGLGLVNDQLPKVTAASDLVIPAWQGMNDAQYDSIEAMRIARSLLPTVGEAYDGYSKDIISWEDVVEKEHTKALEAQRTYTTEALGLLQTFRSDIEKAYSAAQDAGLDFERTTVAIATKQAELTALDKEYTDKHKGWTKVQGAQWRLRRDEALAEMSALKLHLALIGDDIQKTAGLKALLASKDMKDGLTSKMPEVKASYEALRAEALSKLQAIATQGGPAAKAAAAIVAKYLDSSNPASPLYNAGKWGWRTGQSYADNLAAALRAGLPAAAAALRATKSLLIATSPPGPESPLHDIDKWGARTGEAWTSPLVAALEGAAARIRSPLAAVRDVLSTPYGPPAGLSLAAAGAGIGSGGGFSRNGSPLDMADAARPAAVAATPTVHLHMPDARGRDPFAVLDRAARYQRFGLLDSPGRTRSTDA